MARGGSIFFCVPDLLPGLCGGAGAEPIVLWLRGSTTSQQVPPYARCGRAPSRSVAVGSFSTLGSQKQGP